MAALTCDLCGGKLVMGSGGIAVCDSCGMEHSPDRMKEKVQEVKGVVRVDNTHMTGTYLEMCATALEASNHEEAESYANKVIEIDPRSAKAWLYKGQAAGWQTTGRNNRYPESIVNWINAANFAAEDEKAEIVATIENEAVRIGAAILQMKCNSFANYRSEDGKDEILGVLNMIEKQLDLLKQKAEIDVYTDNFKTFLARKVNTSTIEASNNADKEFGPENRNRGEFEWRRFTAAQDCCLELLEKAFDLASDDSLRFTISKNYIAIAKEVRDSCSYKFEASAYTDGRYVQEYSFTSTAKAARTTIINKWEKKRDLYDPEKRKDNAFKAVTIYKARCGEVNRKLAIEQYWVEHAGEKAALENELAEIETKKSQLKTDEATNSDKREMNKINKEILSVYDQMNALGLFKSKEKKVLAAKIDELTASKTAYEARWNAARENLVAAESALNARKAEISRELTKDRGTAKIVPKQYLTLRAGAVSPLDVVAYHKNVLPEGFAVDGEGENALENYSQSLILRAKILMMALGGDADDMKAGKLWEENPEARKDYRINFLANGEEMETSFNFGGTSPNAGITRSNYYYEFEGEKEPENIANVIQIILSSIPGICPSLDLTGLETKIAEAAYGVVPNSTIKAEDVTIEITGGAERDLKIAIKPSEAE